MIQQFNSVAAEDLELEAKVDSFLTASSKFMKPTRSRPIRGAGFKANLASRNSQPENPDQLQLLAASAKSVAAGGSFFCPRRFNRFPQFTIFMQPAASRQKGREISISPRLLSLLSSGQEPQETSTGEADSAARHSRPSNREEKKYDPFERVLVEKNIDN
jgi:hypothetical protein